MHHDLQAQSSQRISNFQNSSAEYQTRFSIAVIVDIDELVMLTWRRPATQLFGNLKQYVVHFFQSQTVIHSAIKTVIFIDLSHWSLMIGLHNHTVIIIVLLSVSSHNWPASDSL